MSDFMFYELQGGVDLVSSKTNLEKTGTKVYWADSTNVEIYKNNGVARMKGNATILNTPDGSGVIGMFEYKKNGSKNLVLNTTNGDFYYYNGVELLLKKSGLDGTAKPHYINYLNGVVVANGVDEPFFFETKSDRSINGTAETVADNTTLTGINTYFKTSLSVGDEIIVGTETRVVKEIIGDTEVEVTEAFETDQTGVSIEKTDIVYCCVDNDYGIKGKALVVYQGRLWIGDGSTLYYSALGRYNDWTTKDDAGYIANFHNDSSDIVALEIYKEYLAIYKEDQTYLLTGSSPDEFCISPFANKGSVSPFGIVTIENSQYFYNAGVFTLEQKGELNQIRLSSELSSKIHSELDELDRYRFDEIIALPYESKCQVWFYLPYNDSEYLCTCWIYDYVHKAWFKRVVPQKVTTACYYDGDIYIGTEDGKILIEDHGNTFDGDAVEFKWHSPFFAFSKPNKRKTIEEFIMTLDSSVTNKFNFATCADSNDVEVDNNVLLTTVDSTTLVWDDGSWYEKNKYYIWSPELEESNRTNISGSNYSFQIRIQGDSADHNFALVGFEFRDVLVDE